MKASRCIFLNWLPTRHCSGRWTKVLRVSNRHPGKLSLASLIAVFLLALSWTGVRAQEPTYVGSRTCARCHAAKYALFMQTWHPNMVREASDDNILGNLNSKDPDLSFSREDIIYVVGGQYKQRYLTELDGELYVLPAEWNIVQKEWVPYYPDEWRQRPYKQFCAGCHTTGYNPRTGQWKELGVRCEACHGPGSQHVDSTGNRAYIVNPARLDFQCLMCHEGGTVGAPIVPDDHAGMNNENCHRCHVASVQPIAMTVAAPPPQIPHAVKGRDDCLMCHKLGIGQAPRYPDNHAGRGNDLCPVCHVALATSQLSGKEIFDSVCARCHGINGQGGASPALNTREFLTTRSDADIRQAIVSGRGVSEMLSWGDLGLLTDDQIDDLVAYIRSWEATAPSVVSTPAVGRLTASLGRVSEGKQLFARFCSGCHGLDGEKEIGGVVLHSDELLERLDDVSIAYYVRDGGQEMPSFHALLTTEDLNDLLAFIRSWQARPSAAATSTLTLSGAQIFARVCARCHGPDGEGGTGPALNSRQFFTTHTNQDIREHIERGTLGTSMLSWGDLGLLTQAQIDDLVAFIRSWEATAPVVAEVHHQPASAAQGTAARGEKLFAQFCSGCHGLQGEVELSGVVLHSEKWLTSLSDETIARQISEGGRAMPSFHAILTRQDLNDLLAFLRSWQTTGAPQPQPTSTPTPAPTATPVPATVSVPSFADDIMPLLQAKCSACHGSMGGWSAATYEDVVNSGDHGPAVVPGDPAGSLLLQKLKGTQTMGSPMPLAGPLPTEEIALIEAWIAAGAPGE